MNAILGYGISLLFFMTGVLIPMNSSEASAPSEPAVTVEITVENPVWAESQGIRETEPPFRAKKALPQLPPVKTDHRGKRQEVPQDPKKRCPRLSQYSRRTVFIQSRHGPTLHGESLVVGLRRKMPLGTPQET